MGLIKSNDKKSFESKVLTFLKKSRILLLLCLFWFLGHVFYTVYDGLKIPKHNADVALVLGNKVNEDGTLSKRLEKRMECALALFKEGKVEKIIVSGGLGHEGFYEGDKMKEYLVMNQVPNTCIIVDNYGDNTIASVENTLKLKEGLKFKNIIVVSQYFHLLRAKMLFRHRGFDKVSSASPWYFEFRDLPSIAREFVAFYVQL